MVSALLVEIAPETKATSASTLGCMHVACAPISQPSGTRHVVKQHAVIRLVDAELLLHGERGQADLAPDQTPSGGEPALAC